MVIADERYGYAFSDWTVNVGGVTLSNSAFNVATFAMPATDVVVTANWRFLQGLNLCLLIHQASYNKILL